MRKSTKRTSDTDEFADLSISEEEAVLAARHAFTFLVTCAEGEVEGITLGERIFAAQAVLEHTARVPRLMDTLMEGVGLLSDEDVMAAAAVIS